MKNLAVAIFKHLSEILPKQEKKLMHDNLSWIPLVASILFVACTGYQIKDRKIDIIFPVRALSLGFAHLPVMITMQSIRSDSWVG